MTAATGSITTKPAPASIFAKIGRGRYGHLMALSGGALAPLALAPFEYWPLAIVACLSLLISLEHAKNSRQAAFRGWLFGTGLYGVGVSWVYVSIHQFGNAPIALAATLTALFAVSLALTFGLHGYLYKRYLAGRPLAIILGFPLLWILAEWFRSWFLTGFPWLLIGYAPLDSWLAGWAPITGVYGLSGFCALAAGCLYLIPTRTRKQQLRLSLLALLPFFSGALLQQHAWTQPTDQPPLQVALVQGNIAQQLKWSPQHRQQIIDHYQSLSAPLLDRSTPKTELIVWPETAVPLLYDIALQQLASFEQSLLDANTGLISGVPYRTLTPANTVNPTRFHNSIMGLGNADGLYHKQRLVPFGEYVPLESWLRGLIDFFDLPMSSFSLGPANQPPLQLQLDSGPTAISAYICYEIVYPDLVAETASSSNLLLTISNDSWFGDSFAPHQHLQMAQMRALETGRYLIRATNNGISALVAPNGEILANSRQFVVEILRGEVQPMTGVTPFMWAGSTPLILFCLLGLGLVSRTRRHD
ncbi:MAG: apolipoprotein N-acyltransferase [Motiliproteus sp.]